MPKYLKAMGRCACGEPVPLRNKREAEGARCSRCAETDRLFRCAKYKNEEAKRLHELAQPVDHERPSVEALAQYLRAAAAALQSAAYASEAISRRPHGSTPASLRRWVVWVNRRTEWGAKMATAVAPLLENARRHVENGLDVVSGGGTDSGPSRKPPTLRLLRDEEAT